MNYEIIEDFLPKKDFDRINSLFFIEKKFTYLYNGTISTPEGTPAFYFLNRIFPFSNTIDPNFFKLVNPIFYHANITSPTRVQVNCFIKQPHHIPTYPHRDQPGPHNVLLYSINTNNGYTILDPKGENIKIPSKANQALFFDGSIEHQAVTQTDKNVRINVNINF